MSRWWSIDEFKDLLEYWDNHSHLHFRKRYGVEAGSFEELAIHREFEGEVDLLGKIQPAYKTHIDFRISHPEGYKLSTAYARSVLLDTHKPSRGNRSNDIQIYVNQDQDHLAQIIIPKYTRLARAPFTPQKLTQEQKHELLYINKSFL